MNDSFTMYQQRLKESIDSDVSFELPEKTIDEIFDNLPKRIEGQRPIIDGVFRERFGIDSITELTNLIVPEEFSKDSLLFISAEQIPRASLRSFVELTLIEVLNASGYRAKLAFNGFTKDMYVDTVVKKAACSLRDYSIGSPLSPIVLTKQEINAIPKVYGTNGNIIEGVTLDSLQFNKLNLGKDRLLFKSLPYRFIQEINNLGELSVPDFQARLLRNIFPSYIIDDNLAESKIYIGDDSKYKNVSSRMFLQSGVQNSDMNGALFNVVFPDGRVLVGKSISEVKDAYQSQNVLIIPSAEDYYGFRGEFAFPIYPAFFATRGILLENLSGLGKFDLMMKTSANFKANAAEILYMNIPWSSDIVGGKIQIGSITTPLNLIKPKSTMNEKEKVLIESAEIRIKRISERVLSSIGNIGAMGLSDLYLMINTEVLNELYSTYEV